MPIDLTTDFSPGEMQPGATYTHFKVMTFDCDLFSKRIRCAGYFGTMSGSVFTQGVAMRSYEFTGTDYDALVAEVANNGEVIYAGVARVLYAKLQAVDARLAGTIV